MSCCFLCEVEGLLSEASGGKKGLMPASQWINFSNVSGRSFNELTDNGIFLFSNSGNTSIFEEAGIGNQSGYGMALIFKSINSPYITQFIHFYSITDSSKMNVYLRFSPDNGVTWNNLKYQINNL